MGTKISERIKKHIIEWDEVRGDLLLKEYQPTTWNSVSGDYDVSLVATKKVGGADYANMFDFSSNTVTTISSSNTWYLLGCTTTSVYSKGFTHSNGRLTKVNNGYNPIKLEGAISVSDGNNNEVDVAFFKNGVILQSSRQSIVTTSGGKSSAIPFHCMTEMNDGDYIEVYINNTTASTNITLEDISVIVTEIC